MDIIEIFRDGIAGSKTGDAFCFFEIQAILKCSKRDDPVVSRVWDYAHSISGAFFTQLPKGLRPSSTLKKIRIFCIASEILSWDPYL